MLVRSRALLALLRRPAPRLCRRGLYSHPVYQHDPPVPLDAQSVLLPGPERVRASALLQDPKELVWRIPGAEDVENCFHMLEHGMRVSGDGDCIGSRSSPNEEYKWLKYSEVIERSKWIGSGLLECVKGPLVGIFAYNREEFLLSLCGCAAYSLVSVPIYPQSGLPSILFIIQQCELEVVIVEGAERALQLVERARELPSLRTLVAMDPPSRGAVEAAREAGWTLLSMADLQARGRSNLQPLKLPGPDDLFCIPYTSGTTGLPKGVMLTNKNLVACACGLRMGYGPAGNFGGTIMSYLPPAHVYEIANQLISLYFARRVAFYSGDIRGLMDEVRHVRPDILPLVPRLMSQLYAQALATIKKKPLKSLVLKTALKKKEGLILRGDPQRRTLWDRLLFAPFRGSMGGNMHMVVTTSAPVPPEVMRFFRRASSAYLMECYGQTETFAATLTLPNEIDGGMVGPPIPTNHIKLVDVPEMGYFAEQDVGEVCIKGTNVFKGYYKNEAATQESLKDGWQHTGDIGRWLSNGNLQIIDRKKHLFKLSQGEYIAPEKVEGAYSHLDLVAQIFVDGHPHENFVVALVVAEPNSLKSWLQAKGNSVDPDKIPHLLQQKEVKMDFLKALHQVGEKQNLNRLEQVRNVAFLSEPFSVANHLLTPTLKLKRHEARKRYQRVIDALYQEGPL